jgi:acetoin utilization protein AcuB
MLVRDVMAWNVVTIPSETPIMEARRIMESRKVLRLPVVDKGKLVGMVSRERINRVGPSPATSLSVWEINYLLAKMTVKEIMAKDVITVSPTTSVEAAVALAQAKQVGALPVVEGGKLLGIVTTNDFFYKVLNPMLGIGMPGTRVKVSKAAGPKGMQDIGDALAKQGAKMIIIHQGPPFEGEEEDIYIQIDTADPGVFMKELTGKGYKTELQPR